MITDYEIELQIIDIDLQTKEFTGFIKEEEMFWKEFKKIANEKGIPDEYINNYIPKEFNNPYKKKTRKNRY